MPRLARLTLGMGMVTLLVGILHFIMMPKLLGMIADSVGARAAGFVVPMFYINHIGTGVFLLVLGFMLTFAVAGGMARSERWAGLCCVSFGVGLVALVGAFLLTLPPMFLSAIYFQLALVGLGVAGISLTIPVLVKWRAFRSPPSLNDRS
jgi:hypothetical protein